MSGGGYGDWRGRFAAAIDPRLYPPAHLDALVEAGRAHFLAAGDAAILFERRVYPSGAAAVHGLVAAGDSGRIVSLLIPTAEEWGRSNGCISAVIESRPGWARLLESSGYAPHQLTIWKDL